MIANSREAEITAGELRRFDTALAEMDTKPSECDQLIHEALRAGIASEAQHLRGELAAFEAVKAGRIRQLPFTSINDLVEILAAARSAANLTEAELAERLGQSQQEVQRYEAERFRGASLERIQEFVDALDVQINGSVSMPAAVTRPAGVENVELNSELRRSSRISRAQR